MADKASFKEKFLIILSKSLSKTIPSPISRNGKRITFVFKIAFLLIYARIKKINIIITCFHRTAEEQNKRFKEGKSLCDGYLKPSMHQFWFAIDILILEIAINEAFINPIWLENWGQIPKDRNQYLILGRFWEKIGGKWGGFWKERGITKMDDIFHFQL